MKLGFVLSAFFAVLLCSVAFGDVSGCYQPTYDTVNGWYEFADGFNNTIDNNATYAVNGSLINSTIASRMGANASWDVLYSFHYMDANDDRGLAYLFNVSGNGSYYAFVQFNDSVWGIENLTSYVNGATRVYTAFNDNGGNVKNPITRNAYFLMFHEDVVNKSFLALKDFHLINSDGSFVIKVDYLLFSDEIMPFRTATGSAGCLDDNDGTHFGAKAENAVCRLQAVEFKWRGWKEDQNVIDTGWTNDPVESHVHFLNVTKGGVDFVKRVFPHDAALTGTPLSGGVGIIEDYLKDAYDCRYNQGQVCFSVWEGSDECVLQEGIGNVSCWLNGVEVEVPEGNTTIVQANTTNPRFDYLGRVVVGGQDVYGVTKWWEVMYELDPDEQSYVHLFKTQDAASRLNFYVYGTTPDEFSFDNPLLRWLIDPLGNSQPEKNVLEDAKTMFYVGYNSPTGNVDNIPLDALLINTSLEIEGSYCSNFIYPLGKHHWEVDFLSGYNSTHFKYSNGYCNDGNLRITYTTLLHEDFVKGALDAEQNITWERGKTWNSNFGKPLFKDSERNLLFRYFMVWFDVLDDSLNLYDGEILLGDNENFKLAYNYTLFEPSSECSQNWTYGTYEYNCEVPSGYTDVFNLSSGTITINEPYETQIVRYQKYRNMWMELYLTDAGSPMSNKVVTCSNGAFGYSDSDGFLNFSDWSLSPNVNVNCYASYDGQDRNVSFPIGDYYNSQGYGSGVTCRDFMDRPAYVFVWDISRQNALVQVQAYVSETDVPVIGATVYYDGTVKGSTDDDGRINFYVPFNYSNHNVTLVHDEFYTATEFYELSDYIGGITVRMTLRAGSNYLNDYRSSMSYAKGKTQAGFLDMIASPLFMASFVIVAAVIFGAKHGGAIGALGGASVVCLVMSYMGMFPWAVTYGIWLLAVLILVSGFGNRFRGASGGV